MGLFQMTRQFVLKAELSKKPMSFIKKKYWSKSFLQNRLCKRERVKILIKYQRERRKIVYIFTSTTFAIARRSLY